MRRELRWALVVLAVGFLVGTIGYYVHKGAGPPVCPTCGRSDQTVRIFYGKPGPDGVPPGYISGGCEDLETAPSFKCERCGTLYGDRRDRRN